MKTMTIERTLELLDIAENEIHQNIKNIKNIYIDDVSWTEGGFRIPIFRFRESTMEAKQIDGFRWFYDPEDERGDEQQLADALDDWFGYDRGWTYNAWH